MVRSTAKEGQNQAKSSLTVVYRGGRVDTPKAHRLRSLHGCQKKAQCYPFVGVITPLLRSIAPCLSSCVSFFVSF
jgi:hypothetical protein